MTTGFSTIEQAVDAIGRGEVVIVVDAEDRENEGDFICAAEKATAETINFILNGRGELCVPVLPEVCERLDRQNDALERSNELWQFIHRKLTEMGVGIVAHSSRRDVALERIADVMKSIGEEWGSPK